MVILMKVAFDKAVKELTPKQCRAIPLLASGKTGKYVASAVNCNPATISQWINHHQEFRNALDAFSEGSLHLAQVQLEALSLTATEKLRDLLLHATSEQVRLRAIELIISAVGIGGGVNKGQQRESKGRDDLYQLDSTQYDLNKLVEALGGK